MNPYRSKANQKNAAPATHTNEIEDEVVNVADEYVDVEAIGGDEAAEGELAREEVDAANDASIPVLKIWRGLKGRRRPDYQNKVKQLLHNEITVGQFNKDMREMLSAGHITKHNGLISAILGKLSALGLFLLPGKIDEVQAVEEEIANGEGKEEETETEKEDVEAAETVPEVDILQLLRLAKEEMVANGGEIEVAVDSKAEKEEEDSKEPLQALASATGFFPINAHHDFALAQNLHFPTLRDLQEDYRRNRNKTGGLELTRAEKLPPGTELIAARLRHYSNVYGLTYDDDEANEKQVVEFVFEGYKMLVKNILSAIVRMRDCYKKPDDVILFDTSALSRLPHEQANNAPQTDIEQMIAIMIDPASGGSEEDSDDEKKKVVTEMEPFDWNSMIDSETESGCEELSMYAEYPKPTSVISVKDLFIALTDRNVVPCNPIRAKALETALDRMVDEKA